MTSRKDLPECWGQVGHKEFTFELIETEFPDNHKIDHSDDRSCDGKHNQGRK